ncbi:MULTISPECIES: D-xylose 1-dehydrogenase Gfo6 [Haloferax]|uniref:Glucose--fructose oxidoreductase n=1 Tax=Haloferax massiliensis TaxID=1476858 RepID=A0A0D6JWF0_9EURY|nr:MULTISPECIES: D-xylose 1-dehydrogenase Gfo6 [Haloferax]MDS0242254.1 Gfo/Idh/MocA family oxidoreductase [Haloferax sp. S2CR25]MDS0445375.1 Gfo/Idh/MocA family oxidoreductase [Haloferax sp. S2CR25-2]CQR53057.1 Glucose--fructose oxidoreductase precursor [Haloferax massiliensis]
MREWIDSYEERDWQTTTDGSVRYALIGLGWWTVDVALPAIESSELGEVTTLVSSTTEKAQRLADANGVDHGISYDEFHEGKAESAYDAVYVGTPNAFHLEYVETAASLGKAILCEKPMESTVERARQVVETCDDADVPLMVAYRMHTDPAVRRARDLIESGFIGEPVSVYGNNTQPLLKMIPDEDQWRLDPELSGYGTSVMDLGIYSINTARFLLDRDPVAVQSQMSSHHDAFEDVPDERSGALLVLEDDVKMVTTDSQNAHEDTQLKITGTEGQIDLHPAFHGKCSLHLSRNDTKVTVEHETFDDEREMREEFDYFSDRILSDTPVYADGRHGLEDMRIISAIHEAARTNEVVEL